MSDATPKPPCAACGGKYEEHFKEGKPVTQHVYTEKIGELITHEQKAKQESGQGQRISFNPAMLGGAGPQLGRLVEVLINRGLIDTDDALYVAMMRSTPGKVPSGYADPAELVEVSR